MYYPKFNYKNARPTPWGKADSVKQLAAGVTLIGTPSHGGIMIGKNKAKGILTPAGRMCGRQWNQYLCYEEDCLMNIVLFEHPEYWVEYQKTWMRPEEVSTVENIKESSREGIKQWNPEYFTQ